MPNGIVPETCPAPGCNLVKGDIEDQMDELAAYVKEFKGAFRRPKQLDWCGSYLQECWGKRRGRMWSRWHWNSGRRTEPLNEPEWLEVTLTGYSHLWYR